MLGFSKKISVKEAYIDSVIPSLEWFDLVAVNTFRWYNPISWISRITRVLTASKYSHIFISGSSGSGWSTGATGFPDYRYGLVDMKQQLLRADEFLIQRGPLSREQVNQGMTLVMREVGERYPGADLLSMVVQNFIDPGQNKLWFDTPGMVCSAMVAWFFQTMGRPLAPQIHVDYSMRTPESCTQDPEAIEIARWPRPEN